MYEVKGKRKERWFSPMQWIIKDIFKLTLGLRSDLVLTCLSFDSECQWKVSLPRERLWKQPVNFYGEGRKQKGQGLRLNPIQNQVLIH